MNKIFIGILLSVLLAGCAGRSHYEYTRTDPDGTKHHIDLRNSKDVDYVRATVKFDGVEVTLEEKGVSASTPLSVQVEQSNALLGIVGKLVTP